MKRRDVLIGGGGFVLGAGVGVGVTSLLNQPAPKANQTASPSLATVPETPTKPVGQTKTIGFKAYVRQLQGVRQLGEQVVTGKPWPSLNDWSEQSLAQYLLGSLSVSDQADTISQDMLAQKVSAAIRADFSTGRECIVGDWVMSETECALAALHVYWSDGAMDEPAVVHDYAHAVEETFVTVENWGPQFTVQDVPFNVQPDGHSGMWFLFQPIPASAKIYIDDLPVVTSMGDGRVVTIGVYDEQRDALIHAVGKHDVWLYDRVTNRKQKLGVFEVKEKPPFAQLDDGKTSTVFCQVTAWGPNIATVGEVFNQQPSGDAAFWVQTECSSRHTVLEFNGHSMKTSISPTAVTARVPVEQLPSKPGTYPVMLFDPQSGERLTVGHININKPTTPETTP